MCHAMPFSARVLKKIFSLTLILCLKTNRNVAYRGLYSYWQRVRVIARFPNIFFALFLHIKRVCKRFWRKVWRVQAAHLHNTARALSSLCIGKISDFPSLWSAASNSSSPSAVSAMFFFYLPGSRASLTANHKRWSQICCETSWSFSGNTSNKTKICCRK